MMRLMRSTRQLGDWNEHHGYLMDAIHRVYERNGWDTEEDQFSLELVETVEALPPWDIPGRFDTFMGMVGDRYLLNEEQEGWLRQRLMADGIAVFQRNMGRVMQYAPEIISTRASGQPITAEQVARWSQLAGPVVEDVQRTMTSAATEFMNQLDPEQRDLVQADLKAAEKRITRVRDGMREWQAGKWDASQWGMDDDPIQNGAAVGAHPEGADVNGGGERAPSSRAPGTTGGTAVNEADGPGEGRATGSQASPPQNAAGGAAPQPSKPDPAPAAKVADSDPWAAYVRGFIATYSLTEDQQQQAWRIYRSAVGQRDRLVSKAAPSGPAASARGGSTTQPDEARVLKSKGDSAQSKLDRLFEQLKLRLERIPTRAQRAGGAKEKR
jgi:hypothetical protein